MQEFKLEVLVDFIDDALLADHPLHERDIDALMRVLAEAGVRRVSWAYYGDGHGGTPGAGWPPGWREQLV